MAARSEALIIDAVRTPVGRHGGGLAALHPADLGAHVITALLDRTGIEPSLVDDVVMGVCDPIGPQAGDVARTAWLAAGLPDDVPGVVIDRQCGSSQQAVHYAAQGVMSGTQEIVIAGGIQNMSMIPISSALYAAAPYGAPDPYSGSVGWQRRYGNQEISQFRAVEMIAEQYGISRDEMERYAHDSHVRAIRAIDDGRFVSQIAPINGIAVDETPRRDSSPEKMAKLPALRKGGRITAALASQIADAAAALLVVSETAARELNLRPRARVHHMDVRADDPVLLVTGAIRATERALKRAGLGVEDLDLIEINEAFACVPIMFERAVGATHDQVNVNGSGIALGHPLGATGARIMTTMLYELERIQGRYAMQVTCEGGGQANVTILERI
jgi:acetyl-CoA C-acetyltransferase